MIFASPFFDGYESGPYHYQPTYRQPSRRRYAQQMRAAEEAQAESRQEYLRQLQEEEANRQAYEAEKRRREMEEARRAQQYLYGNTPAYGDSDDEQSSEEEEVAMEPVYRVMQGPYGQLYKVKVGEKPQSQQRKRQNSTKSKKTAPAARQSLDDKNNYRLVRGPEGRVYRVPLEQQPKKEENWFPRVNHDNEESENDDESSYASMRIPIRRSLTQRKRSGGGKTKKATVVVEDASDSESSENECKSAWRNRRPSPGQWMEPVNEDLRIETEATYS